MMNSKERTKRAIEFRCPDRCPIIHMLLLGSLKYYGKKLERLLEEYLPDIIDVGYNSKMWGELGQTGEFYDEWGILWNKANPDYFGQPVKGPLENLENMDDYVFPDPSDPWRFDEEDIKKDIQNNSDRFIRAYAGNMFELLQWLRGTENLLLDFYDAKKEKIIFDLLERIASYNLETIDIWSNYDIDGIWFMDDWGTNTQLFIHPDKWRKFFKPFYKTMIQRIHSYNLYAEMHSDGYILDILPDLIEIGLDVVNPQHNIIGNKKVRDICWGKICIRSDVDCQKILPYGSKYDVDRHVWDIIDTFKHPKGGLILHGEIEIDVPFENYVVMYEAFKKYGVN